MGAMTLACSCVREFAERDDLQLRESVVNKAVTRIQVVRMMVWILAD
jgi:hypothetical protein